MEIPSKQKRKYEKKREWIACGPNFPKEQQKVQGLRRTMTTNAQKLKNFVTFCFFSNRFKLRERSSDSESKYMNFGQLFTISFSQSKNTPTVTKHDSYILSFLTLNVYISEPKYTDQKIFSLELCWSHLTNQQNISPRPFPF